MRVVVTTVIFLIIGVLAVSLFTKIRGPGSFRGFVGAVAGLRVIPAGWAGPVAVVAVSAEAVVVGLLAWPAALAPGLAAATLLFGGFTATLLAAIRRGAQVGCHCFGASAAPVAVRHAVRSGFLAIAAAAAFCCVPLLPADPRTGLGASELLAALATAGVAVAVLVRLDDLVWLFRGPTPAR
ncbi:hypothetical protein O7627_06550 [Solwaraspora sp. WMMD1047]|uniref:MauE/DoxX family redox-associated membrane protein n=1 Tax=Solwaraspora sp. WMMD1047 TaxID=3016102 RepID=UPI002417893A|nr:MauE/DoxX family redox-associated membrane protein [Solwaraspora sp. WMMD1047]MDG4828967.1 hypothetical protein [Solwaraspora sp. WMMD1047]